MTACSTGCLLESPRACLSFSYSMPELLVQGEKIPLMCVRYSAKWSVFVYACLFMCIQTGVCMNMYI